ncbi:MAG: adenylyl-sulfate kinase [Sulfuricella sp.]|nr:adenylyl-sulfate kinase [Sulfuricella sp.]
MAASAPCSCDGNRESGRRDIVWHHSTVNRAHREFRNGHRGLILWFTGVSGSGKSSTAHAVEERLHQRGCRTFVLDGDNLRHGLCADLGFSPEDRAENIRRTGEVARLFMEAGVIVLAAVISPFRGDREKVRALVADGDFIEIYCRCPLEICEQRDAKGLYRRARAGDVKSFTGISSSYEEPGSPDLILDTGFFTLADCVDRVDILLRERSLLPAFTEVRKAAA